MFVILVVLETIVCIKCSFLSNVHQSLGRLCLFLAVCGEGSQECQDKGLKYWQGFDFFFFVATMKNYLSVHHLYFLLTFTIIFDVIFLK